MFLVAGFAFQIVGLGQEPPTTEAALSCLLISVQMDSPRVPQGRMWPYSYILKAGEYIELAGFEGFVAAANEVRESVNKSAASAASLDYVKFQAVIKSAASAASLHGGRTSG